MQRRVSTANKVPVLVKVRCGWVSGAEMRSLPARKGSARDGKRVKGSSGREVSSSPPQQ